jgi:Ca2+-dependent lipid-binding protein
MYREIHKPSFKFACLILGLKLEEAFTFEETQDSKLLLYKVMAAFTLETYHFILLIDLVFSFFFGSTRASTLSLVLAR